MRHTQRKQKNYLANLRGLDKLPRPNACRKRPIGRHGEGILRLMVSPQQMRGFPNRYPPPVSTGTPVIGPLVTDALCGIVFEPVSWRVTRQPATSTPSRVACQLK